MGEATPFDSWTPKAVLDLVRGLVELGWPVLVGLGLLAAWWMWCRRPPRPRP